MTDFHSGSLALFTLDEQTFALEVGIVGRVVRAVEIAPLPGAPRGVRGVVNIRGKVLPVFDLRARFGLPEREVRVSDHFVTVRAGARAVALIVDAATGVVTADRAQAIEAAEILPGIESIKGALKLASGIVLIRDLEHFLSGDEELALAAAMAAPSA